MSKKFLFCLAFTLFLIANLFVATISAQTGSCDVKVLVSRSGDGEDIVGAAATAVNGETKRSYKSVLKDGMPYFVALSEGKYRVTVTKAQYYRSADDFSLDCDVDAEWEIELYKGNPQLVVKLYNRPNPPRRLNIYTIAGDKDVTAVPTISSNVNTDTPPTPSTRPVPKVISAGIVNGKSTNLVRPKYPQAARAVRAAGAVNVQVTIDESGKVISANAVSGHPLLRGAAESAARESTFSPTMLSGRPVKVTGIIVYNFVAP